MAGNQRIRYDVDVNTRDGVRELDRLGQAGKEAGTDIEAGMEGAESAGKAAADVLRQMAKTMDTELREAAAAADALRAALGDAADTFDTDQVVADLRRMGVSFDEIRGDADQLAAALKDVDGIRLQQVTDGIDNSDAAMGRLKGSSDQSRSVMANLSGNAAQSAFQNLGGTIGDVGVAVGQLAEYAVDGNINLGNLAKLAVPMAGLTLATAAVTTALGGMAKAKAFDAKLVEGFTDAMRDGQTVADTLLETFRETGEIQFTDVNRGFLNLDTSTANLIPNLVELGLNFEDFIALVQAGGDELAVTDGITARMTSSIDDVTDSSGVFNDTFMEVVDGIIQYNEAGGNAAVTSDQLAQFMAGTATAAGEITAAMSANTVQLARTDVLWRRVLKDLADGHIDTVRAAEAWNVLRDELGLTDEAMADLTQQKLDEQIEADAAAAEDFAEKLGEAVEALQTAHAARAEFARVTSGAEWDTAGVEGATAAYETFRQAVTGDRQRVAESEAAWDGLGEAIGTAGDDLLNLQSPEGRRVFDALDELGTSIVPDLAKAFDDSDGDINVFRRSADALANQTMRTLQDEFGVSQDEARLMIAELGLLPEQLTTFYELAGDEEARVQLELLQGSIDALPEDVQIKVTQQILAGDYVGARNTVQTYYSNNPVTLPVNADVSRAMTALINLRNYLRGVQIVLAATGQASVQSASVPPGGPSTMALGAAPAPTVGGGGVSTVPFTVPAPRQFNVTINAAVIGNSADVRRAVTRALRSAERLGAA